MLATPRLGLINVHASLLPRYRGAAPVHRAVIAGDAETGVTIMRVVKALDAGPMLATERRAIGPDETSDEVEQALAELGGPLAATTVEKLSQGPVAEEPQPDTGVSYADRITKDDSPVVLVARGARSAQSGPRTAALATGVHVDRRTPPAPREDADVRGPGAGVGGSRHGPGG